MNPENGNITETVTEKIVSDNSPEKPPVLEVPEYTEPLGTIPLDVNPNGEQTGEEDYLQPPTVEKLPEFNGGVNPIDSPILEVPEYTGPLSTNTPIDEDGNLILPPVVDELPEFNGGVNPIEPPIEEKPEYTDPISTNTPVDEDGNLILPPVVDELPEFKRAVLEVMRQPLEDREVTISRAKFSITYPSSFMLVASMNPSPSGYFNDPEAPVNSTPAEMQRYMSKISGPLLDRIDIHIEVNPVPFEKLSDDRKGESSSEIRKRVIAARNIQTERFKEYEHIHYNAQMNTKQIQKFCKVSEESLKLLKNAMMKLNLSARAYDRILKVARTIADLEGTENVQPHHIGEAIQYRSLDREGWFGNN